MERAGSVAVTAIENEGPTFTAVATLQASPWHPVRTWYGKVDPSWQATDINRRTATATMSHYRFAMPSPYLITRTATIL